MCALRSPLHGFRVCAFSWAERSQRICGPFQGGGRRLGKVEAKSRRGHRSSTHEDENGTTLTTTQSVLLRQKGGGSTQAAVSCIGYCTVRPRGTGGCKASGAGTLRARLPRPIITQATASWPSIRPRRGLDTRRISARAYLMAERVAS
jgi:hypothetical protein